jgi:hypothetical protein
LEDAINSQDVISGSVDIIAPDIKIDVAFVEEAISANEQPSVEIQEKIPVVENETNPEEKIVNDCLKQIEECQSEQDCLDLYKKIKKEFDAYPKLKQSLTEKRDSYRSQPAPAQTTTQEATKPPQLPKPVSLPPVATPQNTESSIVNKENQPVKAENPNAITEDEKKIIEQIRADAKNCKTAEDVKALYKKHAVIISKDKQLFNELTLLGKQLTKQPKQ